MFKIYTKTAIKYIEMREIERENLFNKDEYENEKEEDDEILFDIEKMEESEKIVNKIFSKTEIMDAFSIETTVPRTKPEIQTFWGKSIIRMDDP